tara:strand:- start:104 stop:235 length:132 start_codon:yes stop_codon:yes gene_type:complete
MKIPDFTLQALEEIGKKFLSDVARSAYFAFVWLTIGIFIGIVL